MRALVGDLSIPKACLERGLVHRRQDAPWRRGGVLGLRELPTLVLPGRDWVRVAPTLAGVCGSDLKLLHVRGLSPVLTAFNSGVRAVPGRRTFDVLGEWLADPSYPVDGLVTTPVRWTSTPRRWRPPRPARPRAR